MDGFLVPVKTTRTSPNDAEDGTVANDTDFALVKA
jgi:hypothetical protein